MKKSLIITLCLLLSTFVAFASERCGDEVFLRRAYLTVTGALPTPQECIKFLDSNKANKREALIDELLDSELALKYTQMRWATFSASSRSFRATSGQMAFRPTTAGSTSSCSTMSLTTR